MEATTAKKPKRKIWKTVLIVIAALLAVCAIGFSIYVNAFYPATALAQQAYVNEGSYANDGVQVVNVDGKTAFVPENPTAGLVFYPGGKVDEKAYAPLMTDLANQGILCVLCPMPFNLAVFNGNAANGVQQLFPKITDWYISGHSLGGVMAASYVDKHPNLFKGIAFLGAYSSQNLTDDNIRILSIHGSNDKVLDEEDYQSNSGNIKGAQEVVIEGGNHSQFGSYGHQKGDGTATISPEQQWNQTAQIIANWINNPGEIGQAA